jgi:hypothetical protein
MLLLLLGMMESQKDRRSDGHGVESVHVMEARVTRCT